MPCECDLEHEVYLWVSGAWSELTMVNYRGQIESVEYDDLASIDDTGTSAVAGTATIESRSRAVRDPLGDAYRLLREKLQRAGVDAGDACGPRELVARSQRALPRDAARQAATLLARYESMRYSRSSEGIAAADIRALRSAVRAFKPVRNPE